MFPCDFEATFLMCSVWRTPSGACGQESKGADFYPTGLFRCEGVHSYRYRGGVFDGRAWQPWYSVLPDEGEKATEDLGSQSVTQSALVWTCLGDCSNVFTFCNTV